MSAGFYKRRRGILEHLESGKIGLLDLAVHDYLCLKMNAVVSTNCSIPPGVCFSSAVAIHALCPREVSERTIRRSLEHLEQIGWIKRWQERGKRGNYPILICRSSVHDMSAVEYRVNGLETTDWRNPILIPAALSPHPGPMLSGYREKRVENEKNTHTAAKPVPPSVPRPDKLKQGAKETGFSVFWGKWPVHQAKSNTWRAWMKIPLIEYAAIMQGLEKWSVSDQWKRGVIPHAATWLNEKRWQDEDIPQSAGGNNGSRKPTVGDNMRTTLAAFRATEQKPVN